MDNKHTHTHNLKMDEEVDRTPRDVVTHRRRTTPSGNVESRDTRTYVVIHDDVLSYDDASLDGVERAS